MALPKDLLDQAARLLSHEKKNQNRQACVAPSLQHTMPCFTFSVPRQRRGWLRPSRRTSDSHRWAAQLPLRQLSCTVSWCSPPSCPPRQNVLGFPQTAAQQRESRHGTGRTGYRGNTRHWRPDQPGPEGTGPHRRRQLRRQRPGRTGFQGRNRHSGLEVRRQQLRGLPGGGRGDHGRGRPDRGAGEQRRHHPRRHVAAHDPRDVGRGDRYQPRLLLQHVQADLPRHAGARNSAASSMSAASTARSANTGR